MLRGSFLVLPLTASMFEEMQRKHRVDVCSVNSTSIFNMLVQRFVTRNNRRSANASANWLRETIFGANSFQFRSDRSPEANLRLR